MSDRADRLSALQIDRDSRGAGFSWRPWISGLVALAVLGGGLFLLDLPEDESARERRADQRVADNAVRPSRSEGQSAPSRPNRETETSGAVATSAPEQSRTQSSTGSEVLNASGYVIARRMATISSQITGLITEVLIEEGMEVAAGQVVARLDNALAAVDLELAQARVATARANIATTEANLAEARRVLGRATDLQATDFTSRATLTRAQADVEALSAQLERDRAELNVAGLNVRRASEALDDHVIRAPWNGVVVDKNAQPGEIVSPVSAGGGFTRTGICTLVDMDSLEIEVDVNEAYIGRVFAGQRVEAQLDAYPDWTIPASVIAIIPTANRDRATVRVRIALQVSDSRVLPEMGVRVAFFDETTNTGGGR